MNKKLLFAGAIAAAGFFTLTAFDGKTLAQQKEEINSAVTAKLEMLRSEKAAECDARVETEVATRVETWKAEMAMVPVPAGKGGVKKGGTRGPKVDPLPATTPPAKPIDPKKNKMEGGTNTTDKSTKMEGKPTTTDKKKSKMGGGGN